MFALLLGKGECCTLGTAGYDPEGCGANIEGVGV
jgi:hypothetical protein